MIVWQACHLHYKNVPIFKDVPIPLLILYRAEFQSEAAARTETGGVRVNRAPMAKSMIAGALLPIARRLKASALTARAIGLSWRYSWSP
jgi:hypothetical protein